jgi:hypothetical protein
MGGHGIAEHIGEVVTDGPTSHGLRRLTWHARHLE